MANASLASVIAAFLCGCGGGGDPSPEGATESFAATRTAVRVYENVAFYPACGNEVLELDGATWYQLLPDEQEVLDETREVDGSSGTHSSRSTLPIGASWVAAGASQIGVAVPAVEAPGSGDDTGTVTVFSDGLAHFQSDSGDLATWLTRKERTYNWEC